jgi:hypothetical protein
MDYIEYEFCNFFNLDSPPKRIHRHTIYVGLEVSTKNGLEKTFINFDSFFSDIPR